MESEEEVKQMPRNMYELLSKHIAFDFTNIGKETKIGIVFNNNDIEMSYIGGNNYVEFPGGIKYKFDWPKISDIKPINLYNDTLFGPLRDLETGDTLEIKSKTTNMTFIRNEYGLFKLLPSGRHQIVILNYSERED